MAVRCAAKAARIASVSATSRASARPCASPSGARRAWAFLNRSVGVAERPDGRPLRGEGGPHRLGERDVKGQCEAVRFALGSPPGLGLPELVFRFAGGLEKLPAAHGQREIGLVLLLCLGAWLLPLHDPIGYAGRRRGRTPGRSRRSAPP